VCGTPATLAASQLHASQVTELGTMGAGGGKASVKISINNNKGFGGCGLRWRIEGQSVNFVTLF